MEEIIKELEACAKARAKDLLQKKREGRILVGYTGGFVPEELLRAAGAETWYLCRGGAREPAEAAIQFMVRFLNPLARTLIGNYELGLDQVFRALDLVVAAQTDTHIGRAAELLEYQGLQVYRVGIPAEWTKESALRYYEDALRRMLGFVESLTGKRMDNNLARIYLGQSNQINDLLRKIAGFRKKETLPVGFLEVIRLHHASFFVEADTMIARLKEILRILEDAPGKYAEGTPRILLAGRAVAVDDYTVPRLIEESGAVIVAEMLDEGMRSAGPATLTGEDPIRNFVAGRYQEQLPLSIFQPSKEERYARLRQLVREYRVDGVIWYQLSFDEIYDMEYTLFSERLRQEGIPVLRIESSYEYSRESVGALATRIESFLGSL